MPDAAEVNDETLTKKIAESRSNDPRAAAIERAAQRAREERERRASNDDQGSKTSPEEYEEPRRYDSMEEYIKGEGLDDGNSGTDSEEYSEEDEGDIEAPLVLRDGKWYGKVTIDGVEQELEFDKIRAGYQMEQASQRRFQEAARKERELQEREQELLARDYGQSGGLPPGEGDVAINDEDLRELRREYLEAVSLGDIDKADELGQRLGIFRNEDPATQVEKVLRERERKREADRDAQRVQDLLAYRQESWDEANQDILSDSILLKAVDEKLDELVEMKPDSDMSVLMDEATEHVRSWMSGFGSRDPRMARKERLPSSVKGGSKSPKRRPEERPKTRAEKIAEMKQSRGQG